MGAASHCGAVQEAKVRHLVPHQGICQHTCGTCSKVVSWLRLVRPVEIALGQLCTSTVGVSPLTTLHLHLLHLSF
jgi:hypothetical protein